MQTLVLVCYLVCYISCINIQLKSSIQIAFHSILISNLHGIRACLVEFFTENHPQSITQNQSQNFKQFHKISPRNHPQSITQNQSQNFTKSVPESNPHKNQINTVFIFSNQIPTQIKYRNGPRQHIIQSFHSRQRNCQLKHRPNKTQCLKSLQLSSLRPSGACPNFQALEW